MKRDFNDKISDYIRGVFVKEIYNSGKKDFVLNRYDVFYYIFIWFTDNRDFYYDFYRIKNKIDARIGRDIRW